MRQDIPRRQFVDKFRDRHRTLADMHHQPGLKLARRTYGVAQIVPAVLAFADDVRPGPDLHADGDTGIARDRRTTPSGSA